jgi:hypothetical protein
VRTDILDEDYQMDNPEFRMLYSPFWLKDGCIVNENGVDVFPESPRFFDKIEADYWLNFVDEEAKFGMAYLAGDYDD